MAKVTGSMSNPLNNLLHVATLGKSVGLKGEMKLHIKSDFPEQFKSGATFFSKENTQLIIDTYNENRGTVKLQGIDSPEQAKRFTNAKLYTTYEATRENCELDEGEYFWFDIIGCQVFEQGVLLGVVMEVERISIIDYLSIKTDAALTSRGESASFLIPYQPPFIVSTDIMAKTIEVQGGMDLLQAS